MWFSFLDLPKNSFLPDNRNLIRVMCYVFVHSGKDLGQAQGDKSFQRGAGRQTGDGRKALPLVHFVQAHACNHPPALAECFPMPAPGDPMPATCFPVATDNFLTDTCCFRAVTAGFLTATICLPTMGTPVRSKERGPVRDRNTKHNHAAWK